MKAIQVVAAIIFVNNQFLIAKRPVGKHKAGYWEFPGGKIEVGEEVEAALFRELKEELNIEIDQPSKFSEVSFEYPEKRINLQFFIVKQFKGEPIGLEGQIIKWVTKAELSNYQFPEANIPVVKMLLDLK